MKEFNKVEWWIGMGGGLGVVIGALTHHVALGIVFGAGVGIIIGSIASRGNTNDEEKTPDEPK